MDSGLKPRAVILTALAVEYEAVRAHLNDIREEIYKGTIYEQGVFLSGSQSWDIGIAQIGAGNVGVAFEAERAIDYLKPDIVLFVGIAGGFKDVKIGDVVVATKVYGYESGKAQTVFRPRPDVGQSSYRLIQRAQAEARKTDWLRRIKEQIPTATPHVFVGPIAAGEKLIASTHFAIRELLQTTYGDSLAVEMEGVGFLPAIRANEQAQTLVIRGISHLIDHSKSNVQNSQEIAAQHASAFAFEVLSKVSPPRELLRSEQLWQSQISLVSSQKQPVPLHALEEITQLLTSSLQIEPGERVLPTDRDSFFWTKLNIRHLFNNTLLPPQIPIIFYTAPLFDKRDALALRELMQKIAPQSRLALLCLFIEATKHVNEALHVLENTLQNVYAYDIVPLIYNDFLNIVEARDPKKAFRQYLLSKINLNVVSPFITTGPTPDSMFFGREHELHAISTHAHNASYALIGGRRIGKTSILKRLVRIRLPEAGFSAFYHDCSITTTQAELVQAVTLDKTWFPHLPEHQLTSFVDVIHALPDHNPLVILLDEADKLIVPDQAAGYPLLRTLRTLANSGRCQFVFCGEHSLRDELVNSNSPLYNFANEMLIGRLDFHAVQELVTQPMNDLEIELIDEEHIVDRIWRFTSGHPNVVQRLCQHLVTKLYQERQFYLRIEDVEGVILDADFLRKDFLDTYWEQASTLERLCSLVIAKDESTCTLAAVHTALTQYGLQTTLNQVNDALERLADLRNILYRTADGYGFAVTAFPEVISKTSRVDDLIALACEKYRQGDVFETYTKRGGQ